MTSHDFEILNTVPNRMITPKGHVDYSGQFEDFINHDTYKEKVINPLTIYT